MKATSSLLALLALALLSPMLVVRDAQAAEDCPDGYRHERADVFHDSPKARLARPHTSAEGRVCVQTARPTLQSNALICPKRTRLERVGIFHDSPKNRLVGDNAVKKGDTRFTCVEFHAPKQR